MLKIETVQTAKSAMSMVMDKLSVAEKRGACDDEEFMRNLSFRIGHLNDLINEFLDQRELTSYESIPF
jgi:hypothetical protein